MIGGVGSSLTLGEEGLQISRSGCVNPVLDAADLGRVVGAALTYLKVVVVEHVFADDVALLCLLLPLLLLLSHDKGKELECVGNKSDAEKKPIVISTEMLHDTHKKRTKRIDLSRSLARLLGLALALPYPGLDDDAD